MAVDDDRKPEGPQRAYRVEMDDSGVCGCCGRGAMWDVVGPDGIALGRSFGGKDEAEDYARDLSFAYEAGRKAVLFPARRVWS